MVGEPSLVLGGSGFVGARLVDRLVGSGAKDIRVLDVKPPRARLKDVRYEFADGCASIDPSWGVDTEVVFTLAATHRTPGHPDHEYFETNVSGALNAVALAEA